MSDITRVLSALECGQKQAEELLPWFYDELRRLASWHLANEPPGQTLQATALVHEAYLRLVGKDDPHRNGRRHFFGAAAEAWTEPDSPEPAGGADSDDNDSHQN